MIYLIAAPFAVVAKDCLSPDVLAHEIGHLFGAGHNRELYENGQSEGIKPYAYGKLVSKGDQTDGGYITNMAYQRQYFSKHIPYFSGPNVKFKGVSTGDVDHDNVRVHMENRFRIASIGDESDTSCNVNGLHSGPNSTPMPKSTTTPKSTLVTATTLKLSPKITSIPTVTMSTVATIPSMEPPTILTFRPPIIPTIPTFRPPWIPTFPTFKPIVPSIPMFWPPFMNNHNWPFFPFNNFNNAHNYDRRHFVGK